MIPYIYIKKSSEPHFLFTVKSHKEERFVATHHGIDDTCPLGSYSYNKQEMVEESINMSMFFFVVVVNFQFNQYVQCYGKYINQY